MSAELDRVKAVFLEAVEKHRPDEWPSYLTEVCGDDKQLRRDVEMLLDAHASDESLLDKGAIVGGPATNQPITEKPGDCIGPYKLLEQIGEGGFGVVYLAQQQEPVHRRVAVKIIKPGMDSRQVVARFEAERQALALMEHPNIAKVLDAGATETGRPYFVMELVKGIPITDYCDQCHLTTRERLELFVPVCRAIQHAHQKGIIHRDIKPNNVLIAMQDGKPVPKVIDFGVAKATGQRLTEQSVLTGFAQMIGTPLYMAPEQAELSPLDVDTRSDVYSLGVLLYELLTGTTPFERERLKGACYDELRRIIREEEPARPSARISTLGAELTTVAEHRRTEPRRLQQLVRGDLDWIVMKSLEKDRNRRYETVSGLAADVQRHLSDEPVEACPPSFAYRTRKFLRRNRSAVTTVLVILVGVTAATSLGIVAHRRGLREEEQRIARRNAEWRAAIAERQRREAELDALVEGARRLASGLQPDYSAAVTNLTEVLKSRPNDADVYLYRGSMYYCWGRPLKAMRDLERALDLNPEDNVAAHQLLAIVAQQLGQSDVAAEHLALAQQANPETVEALTTNALALNNRRGLELLTRAIKKQPLDGVLYRHRGQVAHKIAVQEGPSAEIAQLAVSDLETALTAFPDDPRIIEPLTWHLIFNRLFLPEVDSKARCKELIDDWLEASPDDRIGLKRLMLYHWHLRGDRLKAIQVGLRAHELYPRDGITTFHLGELYQSIGRIRAAEQFFSKSIPLQPVPVYPLVRRGQCLIALGRTQAAREDFDRARDMGERSEWQAHFWRSLIQGYQQLGDLETAETLAHEWMSQHPEAPQPRFYLADCYVKLQQWNEALAQFSLAIKLDPRSPRVYARRGRFFVTREDYEQALKDYSKCVELDPNDTGYRRARADVFSQLGRDDDARRDLQKADELLTAEIKSDTPRPWVWPARSAVRAALENWQGAIDDREQSVLLQPENAFALNSFAWLLVTCPEPHRDAERSLRLAKKAVGLAANQSSIWNTLGVARYRTGDFSRAIAALQKSEELQPNTDYNGLFLAMAYWQQDRKDEAREWFEKAVKWREEHHPHNEELLRFRAEAEALMGIKVEQTDTEPGKPTADR